MKYMGMYTELVCALQLASNTPIEVIDTLAYMCDQKEELDSPPEHSLFKSERWTFMLRSDSYYFDGKTDSHLYADYLYGIEKPMYYLNVRCNLKNYDDEIEKFIDWITPYSETKGFIGYSRYEEDEQPNLIFI